MLAKIHTRSDVVLYIIGCLLVLSLFGGCTQKAPPLPPRAEVPPVEVKKDDQNTNAGTTEQPSGQPAENPTTQPTAEQPATEQPATEQPVVKDGELKYVIAEAQAKVLYKYLASAKKTNEDGSNTRNGRNYSCTENKGKYSCQFTVVLKDGSIKDSNEVDKADSEVKPANYDDDGFLQITVDNSKDRDTHLNLTVEASKIIFAEMKEFRDEAGAKEGKHLRCVPKTADSQESCRLWFNSSTGEVEIVE